MGTGDSGNSHEAKMMQEMTAKRHESSPLKFDQSSKLNPYKKKSSTLRSDQIENLISSQIRLHEDKEPEQKKEAKPVPAKEPAPVELKQVSIPFVPPPSQVVVNTPNKLEFKLI